ncbi:MAG TPA: hypothetical protein VFB22_07185 [Candidatus Baltobacteraceae bacterium]|nr:hypothetical protein [Candidatus Baltobacteraceae bacterium]
MRRLPALVLTLGFSASLAVVANAAPHSAAPARTLPARVVVDSPKPVPTACAEALGYEKAAAADGVAPQMSLDAATAGLSANERCVDPVMHPVNEAFLLSQRAMAKLALHEPDWRTDLDRANALLATCEARRDKDAAPAIPFCKTQTAFNQRFVATYAPPTAAPQAATAQAPVPALPAPLVAPVNPPGMATPLASASPALVGPVPPPPPRAQ